MHQLLKCGSLRCSKYGQKLQHVWSQVPVGVGCAGFSHNGHKIGGSHIYSGCTLQQQRQNSPERLLTLPSTAWLSLISHGTKVT